MPSASCPGHDLLTGDGRTNRSFQRTRASSEQWPNAGTFYIAKIRAGIG